MTLSSAWTSPRYCEISCEPVYSPLKDRLVKRSPRGRLDTAGHSPSGENWIGQLRHARRMLGITLKELAEKSGVNKCTILRIEGSGIKWIPEQSALRIRKTLAACGAMIVPESRDAGIEVHCALPPRLGIVETRPPYTSLRKRRAEIGTTRECILALG